MPTFTPHLAVAGAILLIAIGITVGPLTTGAGAHPLPVAELKIGAIASLGDVVPADAALAPLDPAYAARVDGNPFVLRDNTEHRSAKIPFPPAPPLTPPDPVVLPLPQTGAQP